MRFIATFIFGWLAFMLSASASAQVPGGVYKVVSPSADATAVTIYPDNLALITEVRTIDVPKGRSVVAFEGVSDLIIPQSMILREFSGFTLERNFDYDLISKASLFENAVGDVITLTRIDKASGALRDTQARITSARPNGGVVIDVNGQTEVLMCSGLGERTQFEGLPSGLNPAPVMSIEVNAEAAGRQEVVISYLTSGLGWRADYRLDLNAASDKAAMLGWLTLTNGTAKNYSGVSLSIIAGDLNRRPETRAVSPPKPVQRAQCYPQGSTKRGIAERVRQAIAKSNYGEPQMLMRAMAAPEAEMMMADSVVVTGSRKMAVQENVGDYKLYRIPAAVDVAPYQTKQIAFVDKAAVDIKPYFLAEISGTQSITSPTPLQTFYEVDNSRDGELGVALPKGTMRFFSKTENGRVVYLGEDRIDNLAVDEPVRLKLGTSFSVQMQSEFDDRGEDFSPAHGTFTISNAFAAPITAKVVLKDVRLRGGVISSENRPRDMDEIEPTWVFTIPGETRESLSFGIGTDIIYRLDLDPLSGLEMGRINTGDDFVVESDAVIKGTQTPIDAVGLYLAPVEDNQISVATTVSNLREETVEGETYLLARVTHAMKNNASEARILRVEPRYEDLDEDDVSFSDATLNPVRDQNRWTITLAAGQDKVLSYTVRIYQY